MMLRYQIEFLSDWHVGSGLDAGPNVDLQALKDPNQLPYIPGKTIKGLLKDALLDISELSHQNMNAEIINIFGQAINDYDNSAGNAVFSNAEMAEQESREIIDYQLERFLYHNVRSTKIDKETGVAQKGTLRALEVSIPLTLEGTIEGLYPKQINLMLLAFKWLRHLGVQRNRGLGRCRFSKKQ